MSFVKLRKLGFRMFIEIAHLNGISETVRGKVPKQKLERDDVQLI